MTKEQEKAIEVLNKGLAIGDFITTNWVETEFAVKTVLNLIQTQQEEIEKLKKHNKELLRKLRNRVKEVKKLTRYSLYKNEFIKLNKEIEKKDKIINLMAENKYENISMLEMAKIGQAINYDPQKLFRGITDEEAINCIKQYFERKIEQCLAEKNLKELIKKK